MMSIYAISLFIAFTVHICAQGAQTFHDFTAETITGDIISMSQYAGKKLLVINTASYCGYTHQFGALQQLDSIYAENNFEVIGFPSNDFGSQDPGTNEEILDFCQRIYGVTFQMMARVSVSAADTCEIYKWLQQGSRNGVSDANVSRNFHKFCIDEYGQWVMHFPSEVSPFDTQITDWILSETPTSVTDQNAGKMCNVHHASNEIRLNFQEEFNGPCEIMLANAVGEIVGAYQINVGPGTIDIWSAAVLSSGMCMVSVVQRQERFPKKVVIGL